MPTPTDATHPNRDAFPAGMSGPSLRALATAGVRSLADLARWRERDLAALHGMGPKGVRILRDALAAEGRGFAP
ncbi:hypothetical protein [Roseisolibacter sp. H3M3-2]|uniref:hypothetical protein n=1 Tax=Roseisolibacter sp. H3M3-2 TaxID=3031323 RepID=UPI0023D97ADC|nr:hypothetical protein [Roseisolibacter sp. H3M3-2]MDF1502234.1 hypothetical protein [Roseisolibacter sp. H3M3-2]